ncbi:haloacid dehalogenase type II [Alphaproteobacteria bacterium]|jgi:2-haloacid dehalogenase|nr:haloacid dehalogenase type II [Alphaproteobacteria bacterium]|tara:strand:+ start:1668 stop:2393 length:726 start_codon:yes stop_codon:yes gene_type:complete
MLEVKALLFDVFGTVVDWRTGIAIEVQMIAKKYNIELNADDFADAWRAEYQPAMEQIRSGKRSFTILDILHLENLKKIAPRFNLNNLSNEDLNFLVSAWHRLPGWPDSSQGLNKLKKKFILATQSNGNIALMVNMAKYSNLSWDVILGAEVLGHYKPEPQAYIKACKALNLKPSECLMVAAHDDDLKAASLQGMKTAYVHRPFEYGKDKLFDIAEVNDYKGNRNWDIMSKDFNDLAFKLGC